MIEDTRPLGKSVEESGRDSGNLDFERNAGGEEEVQGGVMIPPVSLGGSSGTGATDFPSSHVLSNLPPAQLASSLKRRRLLARKWCRKSRSVHLLSWPMMLNIGRNMPATMVPTMPPRKTIIRGSMAAVRLSTASSTSRS